MKNKGQILLPGLAAYLLLLTFFFLTVRWARVELIKERLQTAASAASLSAARAQAKSLNNAAVVNMELTPFIIGRYQTFAVVPTLWMQPFERLMSAHKAIQSVKDVDAVLNGGIGYAMAVGRQVAKMNGAEMSGPLGSISLRLTKKDLTVWYPMPPPVMGIVRHYPNVFYTRTWGLNKRRAQPPHEVHWLTRANGHQAVASAQLLLDLNPHNLEHNGGFPRSSGENIWGDLGAQSFYPQFAARRIPAPIKFKWLAH